MKLYSIKGAKQVIANIGKDDKIIGEAISTLRPYAKKQNIIVNVERSKNVAPKGSSLYRISVVDRKTRNIASTELELQSGVIYNHHGDELVIGRGITPDGKLAFRLSPNGHFEDTPVRHFFREVENLVRSVKGY